MFSVSTVEIDSFRQQSSIYVHNFASLQIFHLLSSKQNILNAGMKYKKICKNYLQVTLHRQLFSGSIATGRDTALHAQMVPNGSAHKYLIQIRAPLIYLIFMDFFLIQLRGFMTKLNSFGREWSRHPKQTLVGEPSQLILYTGDRNTQGKRATQNAIPFYDYGLAATEMRCKP